MPKLLQTSVSRRTVILSAAVTPLCAPFIAKAASAQFTYKFATGQDPTHPVNIRLKEAFDRIREKTGGALEIRLFPANQLGTETDVLSQVRLGSLEFLALGFLESRVNRTPCLSIWIHFDFHRRAISKCSGC